MDLKENKILRKIAIFTLILGIIYQVNLNADQATRLEYWSDNLRCPVCQGEVISDSPSSFASDMQSVLEEQINSNWTDNEIRAYWIERYGEQIIMNPHQTRPYLFIIPLSISFIFGYIFIRKIFEFK